MGTNYYLHKDICTHCGRGIRMHIGKSSAGWHFSLHVYPEDGINTLEDWRPLLLDCFNHIRDEYDRTVDKKYMLSIITERKWDKTRDKYFDYERNDAEPGLNGLVRHKVDGRHCVGNGDGTFDYITGDFS